MEKENIVNKSDAIEEEKTEVVEGDSNTAAATVSDEAEKAEEEVEPTPVASVATAAAVNAVVGAGETDNVYLSKCVYKNMYARKSLTVHHLQRRLVEIGYKEADSDKDGWYGDLTKHAVAELQADRGIEGDGTMNAETFAAIFDGDHNVTVVID